MATEVASSNSGSVVTSACPARACDVCANRSALWHCAADEAYLCTACDTQVHSANAVSLRHERVRLAPNGSVPKKRLAASQHVVPKDAPATLSASRKRARRPYSHHLRKLTHLSNQLASSADVEGEDSHHHHRCSVDELEISDFLDADEFLNDGNQEVPSLSPGVKFSPCCSGSGSDLEFLSSDDQEGDTHSSVSFAVFFKGEAARSQTMLLSEVEEVVVPGAVAAPTDTTIDLSACDGFFFPGDIPGLDVFVPEMDLVDDFSLSFDLACQNGVDALQGHNNGSADTSETRGVAAETKATETSAHNILTGPFAKFFVEKSNCHSPQVQLPADPETIKRQARAMLQCCQEGEIVPALQLDLNGVLAAWSPREEPWIVGSSTHGSDESTSSGSDDAGMVPDMDGNRDARVLRYKEKRRSRLFSKTIRYEVRKLNAERRPRMKGRFVKRPTGNSS